MNEIVQAEKANFPFKGLCEALGCSRSGYYAWAERQTIAPTEKQLADKQLETEGELAFNKSRSTYGRPRLLRARVSGGRRVGHNRLRRVMLRLGIAGKRRRRFKVTTDLKVALARRAETPGLMHPSDRGSQCAATEYRNALRARGFALSMSRAGDCYGNAVVDGFNDRSNKSSSTVR